MAKVPVQLYTFTGGLLDPQMAGRRDLKAYYAGCLELTNMVPLQLGGAKRRPGLRYVAALSAASTGCRLARFQAADEARYLLAFTNEAVRIYHDDALVATVATPFTAAQLGELAWYQSYNTMILVHPSHAPRRLVRTSAHAGWTLSTISFTNAPTFDFGGGSEAAWSNTRGWPRTVAIYQSRLVIGGSRDLPNSLWLSKSGDLWNFGTTAPPTGPLDDDAVDASLDGDAASAIRQTVAGDDLFVFTSGGPWVAQGADLPVTPTNFLPVQFGRVPAAKTRPVIVNGNAVYISEGGEDQHPTVIELAWDEQRQSYFGTDMALRVPALMREPVDMAVRDSGDESAAAQLFVVNADGTMAVLTPNRFEDITAWAEWTTDGTFERVVVVGNTVYCLVKRIVNGADDWRIERLDPAYVTDGAVKTTLSPADTAVTGLAALEGRTVQVVADGFVQAEKTVASGGITLDEAAGAVECGLAFTWTLTPMPLEGQLTDGTLIGHRYRLASVAVQVDTCQALTINGVRQEFRRFNAFNFNDLPPAFTGVHRARVLGIWEGGQASIRLTSSAPLSATVLAITVEVAGR